MTERKCIYCGRAAFAYRKEPDGSRSYLCILHLPDWDAFDGSKPSKDAPKPSAE